MKMSGSALMLLLTDKTGKSVADAIKEIFKKSK